MLLFTPLIGPKRHFATTVSSFLPCAFHVSFLASRPEEYSTDAQRWLNAAGKCKIVHYWVFDCSKSTRNCYFFSHVAEMPVLCLLFLLLFKCIEDQFDGTFSVIFHKLSNILLQNGRSQHFYSFILVEQSPSEQKQGTLLAGTPIIDVVSELPKKSDI